MCILDRAKRIGDSHLFCDAAAVLLQNAPRCSISCYISTPADRNLGGTGPKSINEDPQRIHHIAEIGSGNPQFTKETAYFPSGVFAIFDS